MRLSELRSAEQTEVSNMDGSRIEHLLFETSAFPTLHQLLMLGKCLIDFNIL